MLARNYHNLLMQLS